MAVATRRLEEPRERIIKAIDYLAERGWLTVRAKDLVHGYRRLRTIEAPEQLAKTYYQRLLEREQNELRRVDEMMKLLSGGHCLSWQLSAHFGEQLDAACGVCSVCRGEAVRDQAPGDGEGIGRAASAALERLREEHGELLGSPRQGARFLCGLTSPALTRARLSRDPHFGSCAHLPFATVLRACTDATR
jgi:ATP-dependent DNA helicase RecQ